MLKFLVKENIIDGTDDEQRIAEWGKDMGEQAKKWLAEQMKQNQISEEVVADVLEIPMENICVGTGQLLDADDFLRICAYLHIKPEDIPINTGNKI